MERAGRLIAKLKLPAGALSPQDLSRKAWPVAVGKRISSHTRPVSLAHASLIVEVEDAIWLRQLAVLKHQILQRLEEVLGPSVVNDIEFRVAIPRRLPQREERTPRAFDEADRIEDPVLRGIYKEKRKRESA